MLEQTYICFLLIDWLKMIHLGCPLLVFCFFLGAGASFSCCGLNINVKRMGSWEINIGQ